MREARLRRPVLGGPGEMAFFLFLDGGDDGREFGVGTARVSAKPSQLVIQVAVDGALDGLGADKDTGAAQQARHQAQREAAKAPEPHQPTRASSAGRHQGEKHLFVAAFMRQQVGEFGRKIGTTQAGGGDLGGVNPHRTVLAAMIDLQDAGDGGRHEQSVPLPPC